MSFDFARFMQLDFPAFAAGALAAMACGLIGAFLVLRRMSLMGDAISHAVLPGIVAAFLLADSLAALPIFIGAAVVGVITSLLTELIHRLGKVEPGASMGVVFTVLFAAGVLWLEQIGGSSIHLDADCVLYGNMQTVIWPDAPATLGEGLTLGAWSTTPRQLVTLALALAANVVFVALFFKEVRISSFDPGLSASQGVSPGLMHYLLMTMVAITTVASFEAVGSILVVAMLIVPGVIGLLLTDRLWPMLVVAVVAAFVGAAGGYATGAAFSLDTTGMVAVMLGVLLVIVGLVSPKRGWISRLLRRLRLGVSIAREDMLAAAYRVEELAEARDGRLTPEALRRAVGGGATALFAWRRARRAGELDVDPATAAAVLTDAGRARAANLIRSHRLWEHYLVHELGLRADHVHPTAAKLEHITSPPMQSALSRGLDAEPTDPHGRTIPQKSDDDADASA